MKKNGLKQNLEAVGGAIPMDHQTFVDCVDYPCCVISVRKTAEGGCGEIRIVVANAPYKQVMGPAYYDNMVYSELVPQDNKFEDYCFRAAILKQKMHAYVETKALNCWTDQTLIPLASDLEDVGYCQFIFEFTQKADADRMASVSVNTAETVIKACIKLMGASDFQTSVGEVLNIILEASAAQAARILLVDHEKRLVTNFCERAVNDAWGNPDVLTYDLVQTWESMIGVSNAVIVQNEQDMAALGEQNQTWERSMRDNHITSLVLIPLRRGKQVVGYMYVINYDVEKTVEVKELVELMSFFLGSEIYNHILLQKLEELSQVDVLTGAFNRRAMINRIREISAGTGFSSRRESCSKKVFYQDDVFRTGGDEFVTICSEIDQETFNRKVQRLNKDVEKNGVACAVGCYWSDSGMDMKTSFRYADEMMYADKKAFYDRNPDLKRR